MASFHSLPAEIRTEIYELHIQDLSQDDTVTFALDVPTWSSALQDGIFLPPLCQASHITRAEFLPLWAAHLTMTISLDDAQTRSDQKYILSFLDTFASLVYHCKELYLPFCKLHLAGKRSVHEEAFQSARGNTYFVFVAPSEDVNEPLLRSMLLRRLKMVVDRISEGRGLTGQVVKELVFGPLRAVGKSYVKWDPERKFEGVWEGGCCLASRMRGL